MGKVLVGIHRGVGGQGVKNWCVGKAGGREKWDMIAQGCCAKAL